MTTKKTNKDIFTDKQLKKFIKEENITSATLTEDIECDDSSQISKWRSGCRNLSPKKREKVKNTLITKHGLDSFYLNLSNRFEIEREALVTKKLGDKIEIPKGEKLYKMLRRQDEIDEQNMYTLEEKDLKLAYEKITNTLNSFSLLDVYKFYKFYDAYMLVNNYHSKLNMWNFIYTFATLNSKGRKTIKDYIFETSINMESLITLIKTEISILKTLFDISYLTDSELYTLFETDIILGNKKTSSSLINEESQKEFIIKKILQKLKLEMQSNIESLSEKITLLYEINNEEWEMILLYFLLYNKKSSDSLNLKAILLVLESLSDSKYYTTDSQIEK